MLNRGVLVVLLLVSLVSEVVVLTDLVRVLMVTCVVEDACLPRPRLGAVGTARLTLIKSGMLFARPSLLRAFLRLLCRKVS